MEAVRSLVLSAGAGTNCTSWSSTTVRGRTAWRRCANWLPRLPASICFSTTRRWVLQGPQRRHPALARAPSRRTAPRDRKQRPAVSARVLRRGAATRVVRAAPVVSPDILTLDGEHQNPHVIHTISRKRELVYDLYYAKLRPGPGDPLGRPDHRTFSDRGDEQQHGVASRSTRATGRATYIGPQFFRHFEEAVGADVPDGGGTSSANNSPTRG